MSRRRLFDFQGAQSEGIDENTKMPAQVHVKERNRSDLPVISGCGQLEMVQITMLRSEVLVDRFMIAAIIGRYQLWFFFASL
jgi:hypothetical protein